ncbi:MAG: hypothetical protein ACYCWW_20170 [Deltaproteobacteria bacterium]
MTTSFGDWVGHVFDHEVMEPSWWWQLPEDHEELPPREAIDYLTRLFSTPKSALGRFPNAQLGQGLWFLFMGECSENAYVDRLADGTLPLEERLACLDALPGFYRDFLAVRCPDATAAPPNADPLGGATYMLWDLTSLAPSGKDATLDDALFRTMEAILAIPHAGCRESALHGLGHWHEVAPARAEATIDAFLATTLHLSEELRGYATLARAGGVQ